MTLVARILSAVSTITALLDAVPDSVKRSIVELVETLVTALATHEDPAEVAATVERIALALSNVQAAADVQASKKFPGYAP